MNKKSLFFIFIFLFGNFSFALEYENDEKKILLELESFLGEEPVDLLSKFHEKFNELNLLVKKREQVCSGEVYKTVLDDNGIEKIEKMRLSQDEIKNCRVEAKRFQVKLAEVLFAMKEKYLQDVNKNQKKERISN